MKWHCSSSLCRRLLAAALGCALAQAGTVLGQAQDAQPKAKEEASDAPQSVRKDSLQRLEELLNRSLQRIAPRDNDSSSPVETDNMPRGVPPRAITPSKRAKELIDRQKNWIFANPDDLTQSPTPEEIFKLPSFSTDGQDKKPSSSMEKFYERLTREAQNQEGKKARGASFEEIFGDSSSDRKQEDNPRKREEPAAVKEGLDALRREVNKGDENQSESGGLPGVRKSLTDFFGFGQPDDAKKTEPSPVIKQYRELLDSSIKVNNPVAADATARLPGPQNNLTPQSTFSPAQPYTPPVTASPPRRDFSDFSSGGYKPILSPATAQDVTVRALNSWNPIYTPPAVTFQPPRTTPRSAPLVEAPRRSF